MAWEVKDQVVHVFDKEHAQYALERQKMYPAHSGCPAATYDWAKGPVCGCGTPLLGQNPPVGGKGEQMEMEIDGEKWHADRFVEKFTHDLDAAGVCRVPWCTATSDNGQNHERFDAEEWTEVNSDGYRVIPQEAEPARVHARDLPETPPRGARGSRLVDAPIPDTDEEHHLAAGVYAAEAVPDGSEERQIAIWLPYEKLPDTNACRFIFGDEYRTGFLLEWAAKFIEKQQDYGDHANLLGAPGQFADMYRKFTKLRKALWEGEKLVGEPVEEVLMDLIGHCFLSLMYVAAPQLTVHKKGPAKLVREESK